MVTEQTKKKMEERRENAEHKSSYGQLSEEDKKYGMKHGFDKLEEKKEKEHSSSAYQSKKPTSRKLKEKAKEGFQSAKESLSRYLKQMSSSPDYKKTKSGKKKPQKEKYHRKPESVNEFNKEGRLKHQLIVGLGNIDKRHEKGQISSRQHDMETKDLITKHDKKLLEINTISSNSCTTSMQKRMRKLSH